MKLVVAAVLLMASAAMAAPATKPFDHRPVMSSVCETMTPVHGNAKPSQEPSPYTVTVTPTSVNGGDTVKVHIKGSDEFKGVYMQARRENGEPVGEFLLPNGETSEINLSDCPPGHNNAYTYISYDTPLKEMDVDWKAPNSDEKIVFRATFVKSFSVFWVGVKSEEITVKAVKSAVKGVNAAAA